MINKVETSRAMIPGIHNIASVGSRPIYRTGVIISSSPPLLSPKYIEAMEKRDTTKYNTITNPMQGITQNPYILRDLDKKKK